MLTKLFYRGPVAATKDSYRERADFGRTMAWVCLFVVLVSVPVLLWSLLSMAPLGDMHWAIATVVVGVKAVAWGFVALAAVGVVLAVRIWRSMRARLATIS